MKLKKKNLKENKYDVLENKVWEQANTEDLGFAIAAFGQALLEKETDGTK